MKIKIIITFLVLSFNVTSLLSREELIKGLKEELDRTMKAFSSEDVPPYYISYSISTIKSNSIRAKNGEIINNTADKRRVLDIDLRVGDYSFDNTHIIRGNPIQFNFGGGAVQLPLDDNIPAIRNIIWNNTERRFRAAVERYKKAKTNQAVKVTEEDKSPDFSKEEPITYLGEKMNFELDVNEWTQKLKRLSRLFLAYPWVLNHSINLNTEIIEKVFVNTEGSKLVFYEANCRLFVFASTKADDGMSLPLYRSYFSFTPDGLPDINKVENDIKEVVSLLKELKEAPLAETFSGPAILTGESAGVFFHEIYGHRVEGHREKDPNSSQTFKNSVGKQIMPDFISIIFDPTKSELKGTELSGYYLFDDEGVRSQRVVTVENGVFKNFLMSRSPIENFPNSNGHGRSQAGFNPVSRQSNLIVEASKTVSKDSLIKMLKAEIRRQGKDYGLLFDEVSGGFTFTNRVIPNAFNVTPLIVYKVFPDERPNKLVRGVDLIGTPLTTFTNIIAAADDMGIFNGICGAESGGVPVSACSPSLLISTIEVQKKQKSQAKPPILLPPVVIEGN